METRDILDSEGNIIGSITLPEGTSEAEWEAAMAAYIPPSKTMRDIIQEKLDGALEFGESIILDAVISNITLGITQAGKTREVSDYLRRLQRYLKEGSLYAAVEEIDELISLGVPSELAPYVTQEKLEAAKNKILSYLQV